MDRDIITAKLDLEGLGDLENINEIHKRVLLFDPGPVYERANVDHYKRVQPLKMVELFPPNDQGVCGCGCGEELTGRRSRWARDECSTFAGYIYGVIAGNHDMIKRLVEIIYKDWRCCQCGATWQDAPDDFANGYSCWIQKDHIIPVKQGGGGCWLGNYQPLCHDCHTKKTNKGRIIKAEPIPERFNPAYPLNKELF